MADQIAIKGATLMLHADDGKDYPVTAKVRETHEDDRHPLPGLSVDGGKTWTNLDYTIDGAVEPLVRT